MILTYRHTRDIICFVCVNNTNKIFEESENRCEKKIILVGIAVCMISLTSCYSKNNDKFEKSIDNANKNNI